MALATMISELNKARAAYEAQLASLGKDAAKAIGEYLKPFIPEGFAVHWTQFTPYFNDGDACTFSVNDAYLVKVNNELARGDFSGYGEDEDVSIALSSWHTDGYGRDDWEKTITRNDGSTYTYTVHSRPTKDGVTREQLVALVDAWQQLPNDMLERAFGDHSCNRVYWDGETFSHEHSHD